MRIESRHPGKDTLLAWAEGELSWWRGRMVASHIRSCWQCKGHISQLEAAISAVGLAVSELPVPSRVDTAKAYWRFRDACRNSEPSVHKSGVRLRPAWAAGAAAILATAGLAYVTVQQRFFAPVVKESAPIIPVRAPRIVEEGPPTRVTHPVPVTAPEPAAVEMIPVASTGPSEQELLGAEIDALAALHRSRFCMNSGITVRRVNGTVEISGYVQSQDQRARLRGVLGGIGHPGLLEIKLSDEVPNLDGIQETIGSDATPAMPAGRIAPPIETWLRENLKVGSKLTEREMFNFMNTMVIESENVSGEAWAIRHLAEQFPHARAARLSPALAAQLLQIVDDHVIALSNGLEMLQGQLQPLLPQQMPTVRGSSIVRPDETWQSIVMDLQRQTESAVSQLLISFSAGVGAPPRTGDFAAMISQLESQLQDCRTGTRVLRANIQR